MQLISSIYLIFLKSLLFKTMKKVIKYHLYPLMYIEFGCNSITNFQ